MSFDLATNGRVADGLVGRFGLKSLPDKLFGTDGIRGKAGELLTPELALAVGMAAGKVWSQEASASKTVIIGQDSRNSSDMLAMAIASGLTAMGLEVWNIGLCPTPCVSYLTKTMGAVGGIMISASHNPPEDNGIKFFGADGTKLNSQKAIAIENLLRDHNLSNHGDKYGKNVHRHGLTEHYQRFLSQSLPTNIDFQGMRIVLDLAWGAAVEIAPQVFAELGAEVITLHHQADGDRINVNCGSTHLDRMKQAIQEHKADMGFAFDGDADRVMAVDARGNKVCGDYILYLWGQYLQEQGQLPNNLLVGTVMANLGFELAWQELGGQLLRTPVGDQHVQATMWETGAMLGGEQSGHILCHHHHYSGDGIQTALHLASLTRQRGVDLAELVAQSFTPYPQILKNVRVEDREKRMRWNECEPLIGAIAKAESAMGNQGRILVRPSGTEPLIRVMVEAQNQNLVNHWTDNLVAVVEQHLA
ncbi:phosphoglucosamine mutase [Cyanobacterium stanieri PCC 7202]|uniref:Phosphoglucosamine mutase n=1 Tax=Cyanobacterium stanieri (strain ATCC 29140 / PCC 7202) TaxID=292563 RepID=K9YLW5_CYASC|nr:phosphoglucosamine mutase [Cyanobacterium stanieri PCC 7202]